MGEIYDKCKNAADHISSIIDAKDAIGIVLGSGLGDLADKLENTTIINYEDIPLFHKTSVPGHEGKLILGYINNVKVLCMKGRFHFYEGYDMKTITNPIRVMKLLGIRALILTNASGGVNRSFKPGTLMLIDDFINYMGDNPLYGLNEPELGMRFPDMTNALSADLKEIAMKAAEETGIKLERGVYMSFRGPNFETPAEIRFAGIIGADAIGMSTVPEIMVARQMSLPTVVVSCITNMAAGITGMEQSVEEVEETANQTKERFQKLICKMIEMI